MNTIMNTAQVAHSGSWLRDLDIPGPEDVVVDRSKNIAYVSSQDRSGSEWVVWGMLRQRVTRWEKPGAIYTLNLDDRDPVPRRMTVKLPALRSFHPCGIDLHVAPDGGRRLFVVNWYAPNEYAVEVFDVDGDTLRHVRAVRGKELTYPNDIVAVDQECFYVSNSLTWDHHLQGLETLLGMPPGTIVYHDPEEAALREVASGITYANGIALDRLRKRLYVASGATGRLVEFFWDPATPVERLRRCSALPLAFIPDNLAWEDDNTLWVAGSEIPKGMQYVLQLSDRAPSHVARIVLPAADLAADMPPLSRARPQAVYDDDGAEIPACSVAAPYAVQGERRFIVGSCFADRAIVCRVTTAC